MSQRGSSNIRSWFTLGNAVSPVAFDGAQKIIVKTEQEYYICKTVIHFLIYLRKLHIKDKAYTYILVI